MPSGDPALTRRLKVAASDYWVVKRKIGRKEFGIGLCVPKGLAADIAEQLKAERETPESAETGNCEKTPREGAGGIPGGL